LDRSPEIYPDGNFQLQAGCGIQARLRVQVTPTVDVATFKGGAGMFNLVLGEQTMYHAVYVSETLPDKADIKFIHMTDPHITIQTIVSRKT